MIRVSIESKTLNLLNQQLKLINWGQASLARIHAETPGWAISGWRIFINGNDDSPKCNVDGTEAIAIKTSGDIYNNIYSYFIAQRFESEHIRESQLLEINLTTEAGAKIVGLQASDRVSIWQLLHLTREDISLHKFLRIDSWIVAGRNEMNLLNQDTSIIKHLNGSSDEDATPRVRRLIWEIRTDVQKEFESVNSASYQAWFETHGVEEYGLHALIKERKLSIELSKEDRFQNRPFGVNLFGYESSALGIGEDLRTCRDALNLVGIPTKIINIPTHNTSEELRHDARENFEHIAPYAFNLICMTAEEHARIFLELGMSVFSERFNIGYWPWELSKWPYAWRPLFGLVDEVWASSRFTHHGLSKALTHTQSTKLSYMPLGVNLMKPLSRQEKIKARCTFGLSRESFLVICSFDGRSSFFRKNPWGAINAFQKAFPTDRDTSVELIIKTMHATVDQTEWNKLQNTVEADSRIKLIDKKLSREKIIELYGCCDILLSLHRAEGFGRILAESLLLGLHVVATNYSGNTDFCKGRNAHPIDYDLTAVGEGEYIHSNNQYWAEPSVDHAANILYKLYRRYQASNPTHPNKYNKNILQEYDNMLSIQTVGINYKRKLIQIWNKTRKEQQFHLRWDHANCLYETRGR